MKIFLKKQNLSLNQIDQNLPFVASVSGGQDSVLLFFMLIHLNLRLIRGIEIVYGQHFWQPKNFFCPEFLFKLTFLFQNSYTLVVPTKKIKTENQARFWRKKSFFRISRFTKTSQIILGQTNSDILEKNLNNLFRGSSPNSLVLGRTDERKLIGTFFAPSILTKKTKSPFSIMPHPKTITYYFGVNKANKIKLVKQVYKIETNFIWSQRKPLQNFFFLPYIKTNKFYQAKNCSKKNINLNIHNISLSQIQQKTNYTLKHSPRIKSFSYCFYTKNFKKLDDSFKPLQFIPRSTVFKLTKIYQFPVLIDTTNFSSQYSRNKIRHHFLPFSRILIKKNTDSLLTKFFFLVNEEAQEDEQNLNELFFAFQVLFKIYFFKRNQTLIRRYLTTTKSTLISQRAFFKNLVVSYLDINITFSQIFRLQEYDFSSTSVEIKTSSKK